MQLPSIIIDLFRLAVLLLLVMAIFVPLERLFAARRQKLLRPAFWTDLGYYIINGLLPKMLLILPLSALAWALHRTIPSTYYLHVARLPIGLRLAGALVVGEIGFYWGHRWMHEIPALWRFHAIHHRAEQMDWLVNTRAHPIDIVIGRLSGLVPMYMLGLAQPMGRSLDLVPVLFAFIGSLWGYFIHANLNWRLGPLEWIVATPAFHHWHHTNDGPELLDKNYASMLPWIDRLFGTHYLPKTLPKSYGTHTPIPEGLGAQLIYPLHQAPARVAEVV
jgi:sterol desaturase/sphingolipid hydroxylase (fatty acid hydroxylase superfamily)